jgi:hypothetical protein
MGKTLPFPGTPKTSTPKDNLDPGFNGPGSLKPAKPDNLDPGFGRKTMPPPKNYGGLGKAQPMPYYPGPNSGKAENMPYYPDKDKGKIENMPFKPNVPKVSKKTAKQMGVGLQ